MNPVAQVLRQIGKRLANRSMRVEVDSHSQTPDASSSPLSIMACRSAQVMEFLLAN